MNRDVVYKVTQAAKKSGWKAVIPCSIAGVDLSLMDMQAADLSGSDLRDTNFRDADLSYTKLSALCEGVNLSGANLTKAEGEFCSFKAPGGPPAVAAGGYASVGYCRRSYSEWYESGESILRDYSDEHGLSYDSDLIKVYVSWLRLAIDYFWNR